MPTELNRIKELAGLQQEAAAVSPNQIEAFKKWYATYSKMQSKDVYNYAKGIFKAYMETGVTELDGASKQDPNGKAYDDLAKIFPEMDGDIEAIGDALQSQGVDPLDMEAQEESAVQEAPAAGLTAQQKQGLDAINAKYGKYIGYGNRGSLPVEAMERAIDPGSTLWADDKEENELKAYMKKMGYKDLSDMEAKDEEYMDNAKLPISDAMADDLQKVLGDYNDNPGLAQAAKDYLGSLGETAAQPVNSSVDDTIQRARAQIESLESQLKEDYKKFQGMKPYKPKKK